MHMKQVPWEVSPKRREVAGMLVSMLYILEYLALDMDEATESSIVDSRLE